ncbi:MAG: CDP-alcohol phosphatidyltransferase family protein [Candidatus Saccharimonadales bacterium]
MQLHRSKNKPDWATVSRRQYNGWQSLAMRTYGIITPGNLLTTIGFLIVLLGLVFINQQQYILGGVALAVGRLCDIADGWLAQETDTKSPLGELFDATADKVCTFMTLIVIVITKIAPLWIIVLIAIPHVLISIIAIIAALRHNRLHPSKIGKISMALAWLCLVSFVFNAAVPVAIHSYLNLIIELMAITSVLLGTYALTGYIRRWDQHDNKQ